MASARDDGKRPIVRPVSVIATGLAAAGAAFLTSRFGIAGTILGTAVMAMLITAGAAILEVYLETAADASRSFAISATAAGDGPEPPWRACGSSSPRPRRGRRAGRDPARHAVVGLGSGTRLTDPAAGTSSGRPRERLGLSRRGEPLLELPSLGLMVVGMVAPPSGSVSNLLGLAALR
jgi:hypothetical protein